MAKDSALYQLMSVRMNGVMNDITNSDGEYQGSIRKSDVYSDRLDQMELSEEVRRLIDGYVSEQNALGSRYGMLAYLVGFSDCRPLSKLSTSSPDFLSRLPVILFQTGSATAI